MTTLKNHLILYDAECPMCNVYTKAFIKTKMLDQDGRAPYQTTECPYIDRQRAQNEIALVNKATGEVTYGVASLCKIIATACPAFKPIFDNKPIKWLLRRAYSFISYNRRVIVPSKKETEGLNIRYRTLYLLVTWFIVSVIITAKSPALIPGGGPYREYLICGGQIVFQGIVIALYRPDKYWDYLGNMMTISLAGALLLLAPFPAKPWFMTVVTIMFLEHIRRTKLLNLNYLPTITWILYRLIVLYAIS